MKAGILILLICLAIPVIAFSQQDEGINLTDKEGLKQGHWIKRYPNGNIQYEGFFRNDKPYGTFSRYYDSGKIQSILEFSEDGKEAGATFYHPGGFIASKGRYVDQKREGTWQFFSAVAENYLLGEETYVNNRKHGKSVRYYPDKSLLEELTYDNDVKTGAWIQYYPDGSVCLRANYTNGNLEGKFEVFHTNGTLQYAGQYQENAREGTWILYDEDGTVKKKIDYINSVAQNPETDKEESDYLDSLEKNKGKIADPEITGTIWN